MATHQISILGPATIPDTTGRCFVEPYTVKATNDLFAHLVIVFADPGGAEEHGIYGVFTVPQNYSGSPVVIPVWTSTATSGNCRWEFSYRAVGGDDSESLDQATFQEEVQVTDAAPTATDRRLAPTGMALTAGNLAAGDTVEFYFKRLDDSGTDTMAAAATLHELLFQYADA